MDDDLAWAHTRAEWDQAWNQSRHLETMRGQWLGFGFTAVLAVIAVAGPRLGANSSRSLLIVAALALVLEGLSVALYLAIERLNGVLRYHHRIISAIRDEAMTRPPAAVDLSAYRHPPGPLRAGRVGAFGTTNGISELIPALGVAVLLLVLACDALQAWTASDVSTMTAVLCSLAYTCGAVLVAFCVWLLHPRPSANPRPGAGGPPGKGRRRRVLQ